MKLVEEADEKHKYDKERESGKKLPMSDKGNHQNRKR